MNFAERVRLAGPRAGPAAWVERAFMLSFGRGPSPAESRLCAASLADQAAVYRAERDSERPQDRALSGLCHMLLCSNEFLYIE